MTVISFFSAKGWSDKKSRSLLYRWFLKQKMPESRSGRVSEPDISDIVPVVRIEPIVVPERFEILIEPEDIGRSNVAMVHWHTGSRLI